LTLTEDQKYKNGDSAYEVIDINNGFRCTWNADNDYGIDREVQRTQTFTGIPADPRVGANLQDRGIQESMGQVVDRTREHLATTDSAIIATRRMLLEAVRTVEDGGSPKGVSPSYHSVRSLQRVLPVEVRWQEAMKGLLFDGDEYSPLWLGDLTAQG
jgi:phthalate 4,5-dioxygenase oxygenase subunit